MIENDFHSATSFFQNNFRRRKIIFEIRTTILLNLTSHVSPCATSFFAVMKLVLQYPHICEFEEDGFYEYLNVFHKGQQTVRFKQNRKQSR